MKLSWERANINLHEEALADFVLFLENDLKNPLLNELGEQLGAHLWKDRNQGYVLGDGHSQVNSVLSSFIFVGNQIVHPNPELVHLSKVIENHINELTPIGSNCLQLSRVRTEFFESP